ncbi:hypothetical protein J3R82DRAFT_6347 [Butyriboletus roseoflavus]|nr:hypothetical protein J3R82DRAFT_6347 [Butyriboletus roseoflavus]
MNSATGLSRRRVATASTSSVSGEELTSPGRHTNGSASNGAAATHAGSAFEGGNKIAFDPRDLDQDKEDNRHGGKIPRLTIMEEVLLLGLKDKHVRSMTPWLFVCRIPSFATHGCDFRSTSARSCPCADNFEYILLSWHPTSVVFGTCS